MKGIDIHTFVKVAREGNAVKRCHTLPFVGEYTIGSHSANAVALLVALWPSTTKPLRHNLIYAVLFHDLTERFLGDLPSTAKKHFPMLGEGYEIAERELELKLQTSFNLTDEEQQWLRGIDCLELFCWCKEQLHMGNRNVVDWIFELALSLKSAPIIIQQFAINYEPKRIHERKLWEALNI